MSERKTLQQMAAEASSNGPWACPSCGCKDWRTKDSRWREGGKKRERVCRNCKHPLGTVEVPVPDGYVIRVVRESETEDEDERACA